ncbi:hypothetical protein MASR2M16_06940 [Thauera terpenica]
MGSLAAGVAGVPGLAQAASSRLAARAMQTGALNNGVLKRAGRRMFIGGGVWLRRSLGSCRAGEGWQAGGWINACMSAL